MFTPIVQTVFACLLWGAIFAVPLFLDDFSYIDIVLGRFLVFGLLSLAVLFIYIYKKKQIHFLKYWKEAAISAVIMNFIHFAALTLGIRFTCASLITLVIGISPIAIIAVDAWMKQDTRLFSIFIWPSISIFIGLGVMNLEAIQTEIVNVSAWGYVQGIFWGLIALATWTWYVVYNSHFMQSHPEVNSYQWTALIGVMTLVFTVVGIWGRYLVMGSEHFVQFHWDLETGKLFIGASLFLGILCSWVAFVLWNAASSSISPALAGQMSILETIFGLLFVYTIERTIPSGMEFFGIALILTGISSALYHHMNYVKLIESK